jgi:glycosyltransferase involved in cell wall biosynthesis
MNILYLCQFYPPAAYGGGEYIFFHWARELVRRGHRVFAVAQSLKGVKNYEEIEGISVLRVGSSIEYRGALPPSIRNNLDYIINATVRGLSIIAETDIDIIHSNTYAPVAAGYTCAKILRKPFIATFHDVYFLNRETFWASWASQRRFAGFSSAAGPLVERLLLRLPGTTYHTVSETSKEDLLSCGVKNIVVVPNGIDLSEYSCFGPTKYDNLQAVFIGRLVFYKNLDIVIRAFKKVVTKFPNATFVVVGNGPMRLTWEALVHKLGLEGCVIFRGNIPHEQKVALLKESTFLVLPSLVEGFGIVLLEAFACCKPVLVSAVKPLTEIVEDGKDGYFVSPFDIDTWTNKMIELFNDEERTERMGMNGRKKLEQKYTIQKTVDELEKLYYEVTNRK